MHISSEEDEWRRSLAGSSCGDLVLERFLGAGKIGYVYLAHNKRIETISFAAKLVFEQPRTGWEVELTKVAKLQNVYGVVHFRHLDAGQISRDGITRTFQYTTWDYIPPGESLRDYVTRTKTIAPSFLIAVVERILRVLNACDESGVPRHGDLHAGNILVGDPSLATRDEALDRRLPIFVADFGYGATGGEKMPKDDYVGLATIINDLIAHVDYGKSTQSHKQILKELKETFSKLLLEQDPAERQRPLEMLTSLLAMKQRVLRGEQRESAVDVPLATGEVGGAHIGDYQVSEMIGEEWDVWRRLFVSTVPARSRILSLDAPTILTGPRGCGKTMFFQRLSERLIIECGPVPELQQHAFVAFYVNANNFADPFARFPENPSEVDERRLTSYANLCILSDVLNVQSSRSAKFGEPASDRLFDVLERWLVAEEPLRIIEGEDKLQRYRDILEDIKWKFPAGADRTSFPAADQFSQHRWLPEFARLLPSLCPWIGTRHILLFIDDYSTPRVSVPMQRILNRLLLQRSPHFLTKIATEAWSTFVPQDSTSKMLQEIDDYQIVDMGEEALFLPEKDRLLFLESIFSRRLGLDTRVPDGAKSLYALLGRSKMSKTAFARRLRSDRSDTIADQPPVPSDSQRRGRSRSRVLYHGDNIFAGLWSGDTRTMIQLVTDVLDQHSHASDQPNGRKPPTLPISPELQNQVFKNRGGAWLNSHTRNEPTDPDRLREALAARGPGYSFCGEYGDHLKAVVEAFVAAARHILLGPTYKIGRREVPRMAFRLEILDDLRLDPLANEIYRDLIRYGLFMRDNRGKSVRGALVPRLYLRRLLLPISTLALSKRDSVPLTSAQFTRLLLEPDQFKNGFEIRSGTRDDQIVFDFMGQRETALPDSLYDDLGGDDNADGADEEDLPERED